jgi:hypothetical protein
MSVVVLLLLILVVLSAGGLLVAMFLKNKPLYGAVGVSVLLGPATVLAFVYTVIAG